LAGLGEPIIATLRDVRGVAGAFVVREDGRLLCRDMAAMFSDEVLEEAGARVVRLGEAFADGEQEVELGVIRFRDYLVFLRRLRRAKVCVLAATDVSRPALRMGLNLVAKRLDGIAGGTVGGEPGSAPAPPSPLPSPPLLPRLTPPRAAATAALPAESRRRTPTIPGAPARAPESGAFAARYRGSVVTKP
jgi:predicted regulator of Ras-like GTPase activity (Roadblock/LC7/MglB family)